MNKKKVITLVISAMLAVGVVGGTLAYFTSSDSILNTFNTNGTQDTLDGSDVQVHENANGEEDTTKDQEFKEKVVPGVPMQKEVWVKNEDVYDQFIRANVSKGFTDTTLNLNNDYILVDYNEAQILRIKKDDNGTISYVDKDNKVVTDYNGKWMEGLDGNFYYIGKVKGGDVTPHIIEKVTLSKEANNDYQEKAFKVQVDAKGIQASGDACVSEFDGAGDIIINTLKGLQ